MDAMLQPEPISKSLFFNLILLLRICFENSITGFDFFYFNVIFRLDSLDKECFVVFFFEVLRWRGRLRLLRFPFAVLFLLILSQSMLDFFVF